MKNFLTDFGCLLDSEDKKQFYLFVLLLFVGGFFSLLGIGAIIPFITVLVEPQHIIKLPFISHFTYLHTVSTCIIFLIIAFWAKNIVCFLVLKKQTHFLNHLAAKIQRTLFNNYIHSPYAFHVKRSSPELISNINIEINILSTRVIGQFGNLLNEAITSLVIFIALLTINLPFTAILGGGVFLASHLFMKHLRQKTTYFGNLRSTLYKNLTQTIMQGLGGIKETKVYQKEGFFTKKIAEFSEGIAESSAFSNVFQQSSRFLIETVAITIVLSLVLIFTLAGYSGTKMLILLAIFGSAAIQLLPSTNRFMQALANIKYGYPSLKKITTEFHQYKNITSDLNRKRQEQVKHRNKLVFSQSIHLHNLGFSYADIPTLKNINLTIPKGKRIAFVGSSGAGKTTLVDIILGLLEPSQGEILVDGIEINSNNLNEWQSHFGYIPQLIYIYDGSFRENIAFGIDPKQINDAQVWHCLKLASLETLVKNKPLGLDTLVGENGILLSGGQRQRLGIARALYNNPDILVMDEATAALDNQTETDIALALLDAGQNRTTITIAHKLRTIQNYDLICVINNGEILSTGTYQQLMAQCDRFQQMVNVKESA